MTNERDRRNGGADGLNGNGPEGDGAIGASPNRVGGTDRVTGIQAYVADIPIADVLHVKLVTVPVARARSDSIDTAAALRVPGVRLVTTPAALLQPVP